MLEFLKISFGLLEVGLYASLLLRVGGLQDVIFELLDVLRKGAPAMLCRTMDNDKSTLIRRYLRS